MCLETLLLLFKFVNHRNKKSFVSTAIEALVGTLMTTGDVKDVFPIAAWSLLNLFSSKKKSGNNCKVESQNLRTLKDTGGILEAKLLRNPRGVRYIFCRP